jgi:hypothetical protein
MTKGNRVSEKAVGAYTFWLDIDVGDTKAQEGKGYVTQQEALGALRDFCAATGLPRPSPVISSGYGVHVYWLMSEFVPRERWLEAARMLKALTIAHKLLVDQSRTADIASVLRPVGTRNFKNPAMPQTVAALHPRDGAPPRRVDLAKFEVLLDAAVHALPQAAALIAPDDERAGSRTVPPPVNRVNAAIIQTMLDALPDAFATEENRWFRVGLALHYFDRGAVGLALWRKFSMRCPHKAALTDFEKRWTYFNRDYRGGRPITLGWLWMQATAHDWFPPCRWDRSRRSTRSTPR